MYKLFIYALIALHLLIIVFLVVGSVLSIRIKKLRPIMALSFIALIIIWTAYGYCPITVWEAHLLAKSGQMTNLQNLGFIRFYLKAWLNINVPAAGLNYASYAIAAILLLLTLDWARPWFSRYWKKL
jgi:hypothetical protein